MVNEAERRVLIKMQQLVKTSLKHTTVFTVIFGLLLTTFLPGMRSPFSPEQALASNSCSAGNSSANVAYRPTARVGGVALDQAAKFLANMTDITGAYYDANLDRIVFVGKQNITAPAFDRDDMAVAIKSVIYKNTMPAVSLGNGDPTDGKMDVFYFGGIEDTKFGQILLDADYKLKQYIQGYDTNNNKITSSVPTYKSHFDRWMEKGPTPGMSSSSRWWISPKEITLKKDDAASSFIFETAKMQVQTEPDANNDPKWNAAALEFAHEQTANYDSYAQETPSYAQAKQLGKIVSVIKWLKDNQVPSDFNWARDYAPKHTPTARQVPRLDTPLVNGIGVGGGVAYDTGNTYAADNGTSAAIKTSSQAVQPTNEDINWTFMKDGQQYEAVAVAADAFRSMGSYNTAETDMSFQTVGDQTLAFNRVYSSFSGGQYGVGRGWNIFPAKLMDNKPTEMQFFCNGTTQARGLAFQSQTGGFESFTINSCITGYVADDPAYHSKVVRNSDGTFTVTLKDQTQFNFDSGYKLRTSKDKNGNAITYNYDSSDKLITIADSKGHQITINYSSVNGMQLISSVVDWTGRTVRYTYDSQGSLLTVTDPNNGVTKYTYDSNFKMTSVTDKLNRIVTTNTYTPEAKIATQKDPANITSNHSYDEINRVISITNNQTPSRTHKTKYDTKGRILQQTDTLNQNIFYTYGTELSPLTIKDKRGNTITNTYDANGNLTSVTYPDTKKITYEYDVKNRLTRTLDNRYGLTSKETKYVYSTVGDLTQLNEAGRLTNYTYDINGEMLTVTDPISHKTTWTRDSFGNPLTEADGNNNITAFEYDSLGRLKKKTDADARIISYTYDANGNLLTQTDAAGTTTNVYDKENNVTKITQPNAAVTQYAYNAADSLTTVTDALINQTKYGYDAYQNLLTQQDALNQTTTHAYDQLNRQTQSTTPLGKATKWEYDANGNITKRIDAKNNAITYIYDAFNRLTKITYPDAKTTTFEYDNRGNRTKMIDAIGTSTYTYDNYDRLTQAVDAFNQTITYTYDSADNLTKITYPDGKTVAYNYDNNDRMTKATDWNLQATNYTYNKNGTLATKSLPNGVITSYTYDSANRLSGIKHMKSTTTLAQFTYERDAVGNITKASEQGTFVLPVSPTSTPTPTPTSGPTATPIPTPAGGLADLVITNVSFTPANPRPYQFFTATTTIKNQGTARAYAASSRIAYYYDNPSAPTYLTSYNDFNNITIDLQPGATMTETHNYLYFETTGPHHFYVMVDQSKSIAESNDDNNLKGPVTVTLASASPLNQMFAFFNNLKIGEVNAQTVPYVTNYTYDPLGRLTSVKYPDNATYNYTFDKVDNRLTESINGQTKNYTYNADNELQQGGALTYYYDNNGNQIQKTQTALLHNHRYSYNFDNKLTQYIMPNGNTHNFRYDGLGNRLEKEFSTAISRWVYDNSGSMSRLLSANYGEKYVYGLGLISQGDDSTSSRQYLLEDGLGHVRFVTDYAGNRKTALEYEPYGNVRKSNGSTESMFQFQSQEYNDTVGMYYMRARYYDQETGRFITKDPIKGVLSVPQSQNPYAFALDNPVNMSDPSGLLTVGLCTGYGAATPGLFGQCTTCYVTDFKGVGKTTNYSWGGTTSTGGVNVFVGGEVTLADRVKDLEGNNVIIGGSGRLGHGVSGDIQFGNTPGISAGYSPGLEPSFALPAEGHGGQQTTVVNGYKAWNEINEQDVINFTNTLLYPPLGIGY